MRRLTFSQDLALFIQGKNPDHEIWQLDLMAGPEATSSSTGCLFGIAAQKAPDRLLRVAVSFEEAAYLTQDPSRIAVECRTLQASPWREPLA